MKKERLEAFSDGVMAIIITIMVLEMKVPHGGPLASLQPLIPVFVSYVLSFVYLGIYWNNHHHMMQAARSINGGVLWANMHLLFWLSLIPLVTGWMGENHFTKWPTTFYGLVLFMSAISYTVLAKALIRHHGKDSTLSRAIGKDTKGRISMLLYLIAMGTALVSSWISLALYFIGAIIWVVPDTRIEQKLLEEGE